MRRYIDGSVRKPGRHKIAYRQTLTRILDPLPHWSLAPLVIAIIFRVIGTAQSSYLKFYRRENLWNWPWRMAQRGLENQGTWTRMYLDDEPNSSKYSSSVYLSLFGVSWCNKMKDHLPNVKMLAC